VIIPIEKTGQDNKAVNEYAEKLYKKLKEGGIRVHLDDRDVYNPGWKYNHWE
jgi:prolyl-tRNA synthetase